MWNSWKSHALGAVIRAWMFNSGFYESLADRVEISTPLNSWKRGNRRRAVKCYSNVLIDILCRFLQ